MPELKVPAVCAAVAFVLSFLTGMISGNPITRIMLTALTLAAIFAGLALFIRVLIVRYLPELLDFQDASGPSESGSAVDISIGEDDSPSVYFGADTASSDQGLPDFAAAVSSRSLDVEAPRDSVSESNDSETTTNTTTPREKPAHTTDLSSEGVGAHAGAFHSNPPSSGGLDILPDLQDFSPSVSGHASASASSEFGSTLSEDMADLSSGVNPAFAETDLMARAIRTILAKDA